ncbi:MAG: hypothetical protein AB2603_15235 [Candidatus Thiodiazotropha endolucinida]
MSTGGTDCLESKLLLWIDQDLDFVGQIRIAETIFKDDRLRGLLFEGPRFEKRHKQQECQQC